MKTTLGDAVSDVRASDRLTDSAVCLVASEHGPDRSLEKLLQGSGRVDVGGQADPRDQSAPRASSPRSRSSATTTTPSRRTPRICCYDEARVLDGDRPSDAKSFSDRLARLITRGLRKG